MGLFRRDGRRGSTPTGPSGSSGAVPHTGGDGTHRMVDALREAGEAFHAAEHGMWEAYLQHREAAAAARSLIREARAAAKKLPEDVRAVVLRQAQELEAQTSRPFDELVAEREMKLMEAQRRGPGWTVEFSPRRFGDRYVRDNGQDDAT